MNEQAVRKLKDSSDFVAKSHMKAKTSAEAATMAYGSLNGKNREWQTALKDFLNKRLDLLADSSSALDDAAYRACVLSAIQEWPKFEKEESGASAFMESFDHIREILENEGRGGSQA